LNAAKLVLPASALPAVAFGDGDGEEDRGSGAVVESTREMRDEEVGARESGGGRRFVDGVSDREGDGEDVDGSEGVRIGDVLERGERGLRLVGEVLNWPGDPLVWLGDALSMMGEDGTSMLLRIE
jgi:hypothetical protein